MSDLLLLPTLDRLKPYDGKKDDGTRPAFGLTLQVALAEDTVFDRAKQEKFLKPWTWSSVPQQALLFGFDENGDLLTETGIEVDLEGPEEAQREVYPGPHGVWLRELGKYFNTLAPDTASSKVQGVLTWSQKPEKREITVEDRQVIRSWPAYLADLSQQPWPLAQSLRLSYFFRTRDPVPPAHFWAVAPIIPEGLFDTTWPKMFPTHTPCGPEIDPEASDLVCFDYLEEIPEPASETENPAEPAEGAGAEGEEVEVTATGETGAEPPAPAAASPSDPAAAETPNPDPPTTAPEPLQLRAFTRRVEFEDTTNAAYFDMASLWVQDPNSKGSVWRDDWRSQLEDRLAEGLRLGPMLVEAIESLLKKETDESDKQALRDQLPVLARTGVALIADCYGPGVREAPDGSIAERLGRSTLATGLANALYGPGRTSFSKHDLEKPTGNKSWTEGTRLGKWAAKVEKVSGNNSARILLEQAESLELEAVLGYLRSLEGALAHEGVAEKLVRSLWKAAGETFPPADALPFSDFRRQLGRDHLGLIWPEIRDALGGGPRRPADLHSAIRPVLSSYVNGRYRLGRLSAFTGFVKERLQTLLNQAVPDAEVAQPVVPVAAEDPDVAEDPDATEDPDGKMPPRRSRGLTFQVDTLGKEPEGAQDLLERIQGVGVMMKRVDPAGHRSTYWLPLNLGKAVLVLDPKKGLAGSQELEIADRVLLPTRLVYREDLREVNITYDNAPIGPQSELTRAYPEGLSGEETRDTQPLPPVEIQYLASDACRVPSLAYGADFQISPFLVTTNGAAPPAVIEGGAAGLPWGPRCEVGELPPKGPKIRTVRYLRQQPVGPLRPTNLYTLDVRRRRHFDLPAVPEGVELRARELAGRNELTDDVPCVLLMAEEHRRPGVKVPAGFSFGLRPPAVDLETWDRYLALDPELDEARRRRVWESVYLCAAENRELGDQDSPHELLLDDPAVKGIEAALWRIDDDGELVLVGKHPVDWRETEEPAWNEEASEPDLSREQLPPLPVRIVIDNQDALAPYRDPARDPAEAPPGVIACVKEGCLYRLTVEVRFQADAVERFDSRAEPNLRKPDPRTSLWHLAIEVAEPFVLAGSRNRLRRRLWENLELDRHKARLGHLRVEFAGLEPVLGEDCDSENPIDAELRQRVARHVSRAELRHQSWGWRGRPPSPSKKNHHHPDVGDPFDPPIEGVPECERRAHIADQELERYLSWELAHFGDRNDFAYRRLPFRKIVVPSKGLIFVVDEVLESGGDTDLRANHHRFGFEVRSRYAPALRPELGRLEALDVPLTDAPQDLRSHRPWRSLFVPCRFPVRELDSKEPPEVSPEIPVPKVRAILPLTDRREISESKDRDRGAGGWLVVLDEVWFEVGGLAEELHVEVMKVISPNREWSSGDPPAPEGCAKSDRDCAYFQLGPDPIVSEKSVIEAIRGEATAFEALDQSLYDVRFNEVLGPAGHHRDFSDRSPRMLASSFIVRPPAIVHRDSGEVAEADPFFWMYQIRLRRQLFVGAGDRSVLSEPTAPYWVQLVPAIERLDDHWLGKDLDEQESVRLENGQVVLTSPDEPLPDRATFELYAIFTREVVDVTGNRDQEVYAGVAGPIQRTSFTAPKKVTDTEKVLAQVLGDRFEQAPRGGTAPEAGRLWMRLMEVQRHHQADVPCSAEDIWRKLFDPSEPDIERGRIVRISSALQVKTPLTAGAQTP